MFLGEYRHNLDAKNRLFIPAKFREELGESFVVAKLMRGECLRVCSAAEWDKYLEPIRNLNRKDSEKIVRALTKEAIQVSPDAQGRVVLSSALIEKAGLEKNAVIIGCNDYVEIWSEAAYQRMLDEEDESEMLAILESMGL
jgi:MraZ protein